MIEPTEKLMSEAKKALEPKWICFTKAVGKTVAAVSNKYEDIYVAYTDGTFTAFGAEGDEDDACIRDVKKAYNFDGDALHEVGLIPTSIHAPWKAAIQSTTEAWKEKHEAAEYARLKAKYEGGAKS